MALTKDEEIELRAEVKAARLFAEKALEKAAEALIEVKAMQKSTHKIISVDPYSGGMEGYGQSDADMEKVLGLNGGAADFYDPAVGGDPMGQYKIPKSKKEAEK